MTYQTEQEKFWAGEFGDAYTDRRDDLRRIGIRTSLFSRILNRTKNVASVLEFGANTGHNLRGIRNLIPNCKLSGIEINPTAVEVLKTIPDVNVHPGSIFEYNKEQLGSHDLTYTSGVLIHINPEMLDLVYSLLYECSNKYIMVNEYYNPAPVEVSYRGHAERLFKRDFAGDIMKKYPDLELIDYGFLYRHDNNFPADDTTWFLMEKK